MKCDEIKGQDTVPCPNCEQHKSAFAKIFRLRCETCDDQGMIDYHKARSWQQTWQSRQL